MFHNNRFFRTGAVLAGLAFMAGCGGGGSAGVTPVNQVTTQSAAKLVVKAVGPNLSASGTQLREKVVADGIIFTSWDGSKAAYGVPVYVEATYTNPNLTDLSGVSVIISTDHPELYDSVTVLTDVNGVAKTTMYAKVCAAVQTTVNVAANAPDEVLIADPAVITMMPSQLKLSSPALGFVVNVHDYPAGVSAAPNSDAITVDLGGYEPANGVEYGANARFPWFSVTKADGSAVADGLSYSIGAMGLDSATLQANNEMYATISPIAWPDIYPQSAAFYATTQGGRIPEWTQITTFVPAKGASTTLEIIWSVTITDPIAGPLVGYVAGTVDFANL